MSEPVAAEQRPAAAAVRQERVSLARRVPCCRRSVIYLYHSFPALLADASDAVTGSEDLHVVPLVPGNHVRERADADRLAICRAAPEPGLRVKRPQECQRRCAGGAQLSDEIGERAVVELPDRYVGVLVESG